MFSVLSSKIFGGTTLVLMAALAFILVSKNAVISHQDKLINDPKTGYVARLAAAEANVTTLKQNQGALEQGVATCGDSVRAAADAANRAANVGLQALAAVKSQTSAIARLQAMPTNGATPAEQCAQADAILLEGAKP